MNEENHSTAFRVTVTMLAGLVTLNLASCDSPPADQGVGGSASVGGSVGASGGTKAVTVTATSAGGSTHVGETAAVGGTAAVETTEAGTASDPLSWRFASDTEGWVAATASTFTYYSGSDGFCWAGCAELTGNLGSAGSSYNARIIFSQPIDLSGGASIRAAVKYLPTGSDDFGTIAIYAQDSESVISGDDNWANGAPRGNKATSGGLADPSGGALQFDLPASKVSEETALPTGGTAKAGFNPASIALIGLVVVSGDATQVGTTTFLVDSVTITKP